MRRGRVRGRSAGCAACVTVSRRDRRACGWPRRHRRRRGRHVQPAAMTSPRSTQVSARAVTGRPCTVDGRSALGAAVADAAVALDPTAARSADDVERHLVLEGAGERETPELGGCDVGERAVAREGPGKNDGPRARDVVVGSVTLRTVCVDDAAGGRRHSWSEGRARAPPPGTAVPAGAAGSVDGGIRRAVPGSAHGSRCRRRHPQGVARPGREEATRRCRRPAEACVSASSRPVDRLGG